MAETGKGPGPTRKCAQCGAELPATSPLELCPKCLLKTALGSGPDEATKTASTARDLPAPELLHPGEQFGHYRVLGVLGGGGMGSVFEADDLETGRRVALKVLSQGLDSPEARERFFREGRLAASINHPNSVYIFGTEEIAGTPVITMELVAGGTLEDLVRANGPMPPGEAVDAVLQIIGGLEAAQRVGILHRDVKPSNCFHALDGSVKIGDFGLSISTAIRTEPALTATGAFLGTPAFCSPEQLRGEELNARSDMYSVGATLFYLLTGRTPFEAKNVVALIATVLEHTAPSPRQFRPGNPEGLARVVRRCLDKQPAERFKTYAELRQALAPYSSVRPVPARLALRLAAGVADLLVLNAVFIAVLSLGSLSPFSYLAMLAGHPAKAFALLGATMLGSMLYYAISEGVWGATPGKRLFGLRVAGPNRGLPGIRALGRAAIYTFAPTIPTWVVYGGTRNFFLTSDVMQTLVGVAVYVIWGLLFVTARKRNGLAAVHDLVTGTRVVSSESLQARPGLILAEPPPAGIESRPTIGPYHVLETLGQTAGESWLLGYDLRLLRRVWIHVVPPGTPPIVSDLRHLSRIGRLRWLTGTRSETANWDAFEAVDGKPLLILAQRPQPWAQVRFWLFDLTEEIAAAQKDHTLPQLSLDRVWITKEGRAKLLDLPAPGLSTTVSAPQVSPAPPVLGENAATLGFLKGVVDLALNGSRPESWPREPKPAALLPLEAKKFIADLTGLIDAAAAKLALRPLLQRPAAVSRARRAGVVAACAALPLIATAASLYGIHMMHQWNRENPGIMELSQLLQERSALRFFGQSRRGPSDQQVSIYIASHYRSVITNESAWNSSISALMIKGASRKFAEQSLVLHPAPSAEEIAQADAAVGPHISRTELFDLSKNPAFLCSFAYGTLAVYVAIPALLAALLFRGGLALRVAGVAFVSKNGAIASRFRMFWRAVVAWSPVGFALLCSGLLQRESPLLAATLPAALLCLLAGLSVALPGRGLPDRLAGTWPVPR